MPFETPTLPEVRALSRDYLAGYLTGEPDLPPNSRARVLSDDNAGLAFGAYQFIARLAAQFLPDTASEEFLERWATIFVGGRQAATFAQGSAEVTGISGTIVPAGTQFTGGGARFEATAEVLIGATATTLPIRALDAGVVGNLDEGASLSFTAAISGADSTATVVALAGGIDLEGVEPLRDRILQRIRKPPMGGAAHDYVAWAREVPGVTRAWCSPLEMGPGSVTVRFMMDEVRASTGGFPLTEDIATVQAHLDMRRPVSVRDCFALAPVAKPINFALKGLVPDTPATRAAIEINVAAMLRERAAPAQAIDGVRYDAQTIYASWVNEAVLQAAGVDRFTLIATDYVMPHNGNIATLGNISIA